MLEIWRPWTWCRMGTKAKMRWRGILDEGFVGKTGRGRASSLKALAWNWPGMLPETGGEEVVTAVVIVRIVLVMNGGGPARIIGARRAASASGAASGLGTNSMG
jgi:hypothetical protein